MKLFLVQHGAAEPESVNPERPLTDMGRITSKRTAEFLSKTSSTVDVIWHSKKLRSRQTAEIFGQYLSPAGGLVEKDAMAPKDPIEAVFHALHDEKRNVLIVGHMPYLEVLLREVLKESGCTENVQFFEGGLVCLERDDQGGWELKFEIVSMEVE